MIKIPTLELTSKIHSIYLNLVINAFKELLEQKHLYQSVELDVSLINELIKKARENHAIAGDNLLKYYQQLYKQDWLKAFHDEVGCLHFDLPTIKIYCSACNREEPFNPIPNPVTSLHTVLKYHDKMTQGLKHQLLVLEYECQSCKGIPAVFLIRRKDLKVSLVGRFPIEQYPVPNVIPKTVSKYYSDAIIAHNCGQTLAGLFLLRTLIEQYCLSLSLNKELPADKTIEKYMGELPNEFKSRFPSLSKIYSDLSVAMHKAKPSSKLFDDTVANFIEHFDAKRIFKIQDKIS